MRLCSTTQKITKNNKTLEKSFDKAFGHVALQQRLSPISTPKSYNFVLSSTPKSSSQNKVSQRSVQKWIKPIKHDFFSSSKKEQQFERKDPEDFSFINIIPSKQDDKILEEVMIEFETPDEIQQELMSRQQCIENKIEEETLVKQEEPKIINVKEEFIEEEKIFQQQHNPLQRIQESQIIKRIELSDLSNKVKIDPTHHDLSIQSKILKKKSSFNKENKYHSQLIMRAVYSYQEKKQIISNSTFLPNQLNNQIETTTTIKQEEEKICSIKQESMIIYKHELKNEENLPISNNNKKSRKSKGSKIKIEIVLQDLRKLIKSLVWYIDQLKKEINGFYNLVKLH